MIYLNPCLFFCLLVFVFFLNISCTHFSDTSCLVPWNLSEFLTVWYFLLCATYTHTEFKDLPLQSWHAAALSMLRPHWAPDCSSDREILPFFIPFHTFPSQGDQWCSTSMLLFWAITPKILLIQIWKSEKKQEIPFNYQGQNEYQHFSWGWKELFHVPPQIPHLTLKFRLNSKELRAEKGLPCIGST